MNARLVRGLCLCFSVLPSVALATETTAAPAVHLAQFGQDAQHSGRVALQGPRERPVIRWRVRSRRRVFASPVQTAQRHLVFSGIDGHVRAVDAQGIERWAFSAPSGVFSSPLAHGNLLWVGYGGGAVVALDERGIERTRIATSEDVDAPLTGTNELLFVASRGLQAFNYDGQARWTVAAGHVFSAPAIARDGNTAYVADVLGELLFVRVSDGNVEHRVRVGAAVYGGVLVLDDGGVVVGAADGHVRAYQPDGTQRWDFTTRAEVRATPAQLRDGTVLIGSDDGGIYGLRPAEGTALFRFATAGRVRSHATIASDGTAYIGSEDDVLYALSPQGNSLWSVDLGADIDDAVTVLPDGSLAVGCDDGALYLLGAGVPDAAPLRASRSRSRRLSVALPTRPGI